MNTKSILLLLIGLVLGASIVYLAMSSSLPDSKTVHKSLQSKNPVAERFTEDPFGGDIGDHSSGFHPIGESRMNMDDLSHRDVCISLWYLDQGSVVDNLRRRTGHKFKRVGKLYASPVEVLEEQLDFMKEFLAESDRMEAARGKQ